MYFKRLEMHGFKSFAEPVIIDFHEGITAIVGPNGSGKSNISDAIRWVLGEQSPKALRGGKMEEVIFNGTETRRPRGMAEVTLVIDNSAGILDIEYKEVAFTRRMYRSGESEYLINNNPCRLKDIRELIMDTGIGVDGYSIIGQGKIADIVSNKPESRREIFEESAGIVAYKSRKAEAERKLAGTRNNLERIDDIVGEIEGRIDGLREDSIKAKRYLELRDRYQDLEINITLRNIDNAEKRNQQYRQDIDELAGKIEEIRQGRVQADADSAELQKKSAALENLSEEAHQKLLQSIEEINSITGEAQLNQEKLAGIQRDENRLADEISSFAERIRQSEEELARLQEEKERLQKNHKEAEQNLRDKVFAYEKIASESSEYTQTMDESNERIIQLNGIAAARKSEAASIENYKTTLERRREQITRESEETEAALKEQQELLEKTRKEYSEIKESRRKFEEENSQREKARGEMETREDELREAVEKDKIQLSQMESRKKTIEELEQNLDGYNYAVKYIMRSGLTGIEGVVGEMMEVPDGLEIAIETALGSAMQNIVCADDQAARRAITVLKMNKSGRLTFLPVSSIRGKSAKVPKEVSGDPGYRGLGVDLIGFDPRYQTVFEYLLGRVCVVDNLNTAIRLSKIAGSGVRFVTKDGEIINASGAITGGKYKNQSANLLERRNEISRLHSDIEVARTRLENDQKELKQVSAALDELVIQIREAVEQKSSEEMTIAQLKAKIGALEGSMEDGRETIDRNNNEISTIAKELGDADEMILRMNREGQEAEEEIGAITREMESLAEGQTARKQAIDEASEAITEARIAVNQWAGQISNQEQLMERVSIELQDQKDQEQERNAQMDKISRRRNELQYGGSENADRIETLEKEKKETEEYLAEIGRNKSETAEKLSKVMEELSRAENESNAYKDQKYQLEIKAAKNETQLDNMKEKLWNEFEMSYAQAEDHRKEDFVMTTALRESREVKKELREIGDVNVGSIQEYDQVSQRYSFLTEQRRDVVTALKELESIIDDLDKTITRSFQDNFNKVEDKFEKVFEELFGGGHAELRMEDEKDPLESGIEIVAQPPGKKLQNINLLSGGEKTMTAIALMFAVLATKPTPFCILDEVEAALDDDNIDKFSGYLRKFASTQFALITHQKATMEHADVLYGITMPEHGVSKVLSLRMGDYDPDEYTS